MSSALRRLLEMFDRVLDFSAKRAPANMPAEFAAESDVLKGAANRLRRALVKWHNGTRTRKGGTEVKSSIRNKLRKQLKKLAILAKGFPEEFTAEDFLLPRSNAANEVLLSAAKETFQNARQHKDRLIALGRPADFIEQLEASINTFEQAADAQVAGVGTRIHAVGEAIAAAAVGLSSARRMSAMAESVFGDDPVLSRDWKSARHIERGPVRKAEDTQPPPAIQAA